MVVKLTPASLGNSADMESTTRAMRTVSAELLAPVKGAVGTTSISPAIRTFRVRITDTASTQRVLARMRASPQVESAALDECAVMIRR